MDSPDDSPGCLGGAAGWLASGKSPLPLPALDDEEGPRLPEGLPPVVDAHVHLFPDKVFEAVWRWFEQHAWPIRYKLHTPQVVSFLLSRGVSRVVALHYAHKPGMARFLNTYVAEVARAEPRVLGLATVLPGEEGAPEILAEAFAAGLKGVKLHCHVQCFAPDVHALCSAERVERVLRDYPSLKLCVPHLGADELDAYERLLERYDNLWLDTTYGTDFPNLPYAWDRELKQLLALKLGDEAEAGLLGQNALRLFEGC